MMDTLKLEKQLKSLLNPELFKDYAPNGLQVKGKDTIQHIVTGVTASEALIEAAIAEKADALLVHHGYFWKGEDPCVVGMKHHRLKRLLQHDINLFAYHLPLDAHPVIGNNAQLAKVLELNVKEELPMSMKPSIGLVGEWFDEKTPESMQNHIAKKLGREPLYLPGNDRLIKRVAWCTGAAQDYLSYAVAAGCDAYITGEVSERTTHEAKELGIHFYACGHHATERYGVKALGDYLASEMGLTHTFIDIDNPV